MLYLLIYTYLNSSPIACPLESCAGWVNLCELWVPALAGQVREPVLLYMWVWVELAAGQARDEKFFVWVTGCCAKAHELNQIKNCKTRGCTKVACQHCA